MEDLDCLIVASAAFIVIAGLLKNRRKKRWWTTSLYRNRLTTRGQLFLNSMLEEEENGHFHNFTRMSSVDFSFLLESVRADISRNDTNFRKAVTAEERLAITLRYLATGDSYTSLQYLFNVSKQLISQIVPEVCRALVKNLSKYMKVPLTVEEWKEISKNFEGAWNFPHCLGALDGKHILLQAPIHSGSTYYNYKSTFSIVLMALVDADYNFLYVDIGFQRGVSDGGVFKNCQLYKDLAQKKLHFPAPSNLPGREENVPFVFVADEAFAMSENIMKPYSGLHPKGSKERIFNYRLSRARRVVENAFGIISSVFRVLRKPMLLEPEKAELIIMTIICLHNFLRKSHLSRNIYAPEGTFDKEVNGQVIPGSWRSDSENITSFTSLRNIPRKSSLFIHSIRAEFSEYFSSNGSVSWQNDYA